MGLVAIEKCIRKRYGNLIHKYLMILIKIALAIYISPFIITILVVIYCVKIDPTPDLSALLTVQYDGIEFQWRCDTPLAWQTYLHDPASISMEGILMFNKHLLFLVIVIVMFVGWLLAFTVYYFVSITINIVQNLFIQKNLKLFGPQYLL
jgi:hypothetical protein